MSGALKFSTAIILTDLYDKAYKTSNSWTTVPPLELGGRHSSTCTPIPQRGLYLV